MSEIKTRQVLPLKADWRFLRTDAADLAAPDVDESAWQTVRVPHDWAITGPFDRECDIQVTAIIEDGEQKQRVHTGRTGALPHVGKAWYRRWLDLPADIASKRVRVEFDGAMSRSQVYCNGMLAGIWPYGYASFALDITGLVRPGRNLLAVSLDNPANASRWYPGAGIYRHVRLIITEPVCVAHWGTYVTTPKVAEHLAVVQIVTTVDNHRPAVIAELESQILSPGGEVIASVTAAESFTGSHRFSQQLQVPDPVLWSLEDPRLYTLRSLVRCGGSVVDSYETRFGIRWITYSADQGFALNGKRVQFNGVCMHHDLGPLGAAVNVAALRRQLEILQEMGCNAIRTSHNPPTPELLDLADQMGFLVMDEAFDEWRLGKVENGYSRLFDQWAEKDLRAMIRRDRNHPCIIMWSIGNEIREQKFDDSGGAKIARFLTDICHDEDPTRPTTAAFDSSDRAIASGMAAEVDIPGWNYKPNLYGRYHWEHPTWPIYGSETCSTVSSRGEYYFPATEERGVTQPSGQVSSYDLSCTNWANIPDAEFRAIEDNPFVLGEFVWTGFDYLGEPSPYNTYWPSRSSYFGIVDLCGIPKDRFWLYQSRWANKGTLHLLPHWTWPDRAGQIVPVHCYSSWDKVELFVNGRSQGLRQKWPKGLLCRYRLVWEDVQYEPGELKAVAYSGGKIVKEVVVRTAGAPAGIAMTAHRDAESLRADGEDMAFINVRIVDAQGNTCPRADNLVRFRLEGPAEIAAVDNGDATSLEPFVASDRKAFNGQCMVYLRSLPSSGGLVKLLAESEGLAPAEITIQALS